MTAFGVNYFDLPPGAEGLEHNETRSNQEEVYVYVKGSGVLRLGGDEIEVRRGHRRARRSGGHAQPVAGDEGLAWVAIGARRTAVRAALLGLGKCKRSASVRLAPCTRSSSPTRSCALLQRGAALLSRRLRPRRGRRAAPDQGVCSRSSRHRLARCSFASSSGTSPTRRRRSASFGATCATSRWTRSRTCPGCASRPGSRTRRPSAGARCTCGSRARRPTRSCRAGRAS